MLDPTNMWILDPGSPTMKDDISFSPKDPVKIIEPLGKDKMGTENMTESD